MSEQLESWEGEGGAVPAPVLPHPLRMAGTPSQLEWAERLKRSANLEFDRVAASFRSIAQKQQDGRREDTEAIIAILEEKRAEVMSREQAGSFIRDWQEIDDQVRKMVGNDPRYRQIKAQRKLAEEIHMDIRPLYDRIVVKRIEEQETTRNGIIIPDSAKEKPQEGEVMAIGHGKRQEDGQLVALDVKVGDRILFGKYSGTETKLVGTEYLIMREDDVLGILTGASAAAK